METVTDTLKERVDRLVHARKARLEWGNPLLSTTPTSLAVRELAARTEALENAVPFDKDRVHSTTHYRATCLFDGRKN